MPVLGTDLALHLGTELGVDLAGGGGPVPPVLEAPEQIPDLAAWYDARTDAYFALGAGSEVTTWLSRAGSLGGVPLPQGVAANQPVRELAVAAFGGKNAVRFDGVDDFLQGVVPADWTFCHNNTGATVFLVERVDSTGVADQLVCHTASSVSNRGFRQLMRLASFSPQVFNGGGTAQNTWTVATASHFARNVSRWRIWTYGNGEQGSVISGSALTNADTIGQTPATGVPATAFKLANGGSSVFKGYLAEVIVYKRVLTAPERASLGTWANAQFGVAA